MKKKLALLLTLAAAGCGGSQEPTTPVAPVAAEAPTQPVFTGKVPSMELPEELKRQNSMSPFVPPVLPSGDIGVAPATPGLRLAPPDWVPPAPPAAAPNGPMVPPMALPPGYKPEGGN